MSKEAMIDLLNRLNQDRKESATFKQDPDRVMAGLDLTAEEKEMLRHGRREEIRKYLGPSVLPIGLMSGDGTGD